MTWRAPRFMELDGYPMDYEHINENLRVFVEEIDGRLNEHNWAGGAITGGADLAPDAVLDVNVHEQSVNPALTTGTGRPTAGPTDSIRLSNNGDWQTVRTLTLDTGNTQLQIDASWQHQRYGNISDGSVGAQYSLRVDGVVLGEVVTGSLDRANDPTCEGIPYQAHGLVTDAVIDVSPGRHTIDLVGRTVRDRLYSALDDASEFNEVFNRELIVVSVDPFSEAASGAGPSFTPLAEGDAITAAGINTLYAGTRDEVNDLDATSVQREGLHASHLPSVVLRAGYDFIPHAAGDHDYTDVAVPYPGYDSDAGWVAVGSTLAVPDDLEASFASVDLAGAGVRGCLVHANVHVVRISHASTGNPTFCYAVFVIQVRDGLGVYRTIAKSERYVNGDSDESGSTPEPAIDKRADLPIRTFITSSEVPTNTNIDRVRLVVSVSDRTGVAGTVTVRLRGANISAEVLRAGA